MNLGAVSPAAEPEPDSTPVLYRAGNERLSARSGQLREARQAGALRAGEVVPADDADMRESVGFGDTVRFSAAESVSGTSGYASHWAGEMIAHAERLAQVAGQDEPFGTPAFALRGTESFNETVRLSAAESVSCASGCALDWTKLVQVAEQNDGSSTQVAAFEIYT